MLHEIEEGRLSPVQVVEHGDERPLRRRLLECLPHGPGDLIGSCGLVGLSEQRIDGAGGHVVGGFRSELLEHLDRRPVGDPFSVREAATADDGCVDIGEELCGKPRLADSGGAEDRDEVARAVGPDVCERFGQKPPLALASDHRRPVLPRRLARHGEQLPGLHRLGLPF